MKGSGCEFPPLANIGYWIIAVVISGYHAYRGCVLQRVTVEDQRDEKQRQNLNWHWSSSNTFWVRYVYDTVFYFFCSMVGFISLWFAMYAIETVSNIEDISGGTSAVLIFLLLFGVLGISGILPYLIHQGKFPR